MILQAVPQVDYDVSQDEEVADEDATLYGVSASPPPKVATRKPKSGLGKVAKLKREVKKVADDENRWTYVLIGCCCMGFMALVALLVTLGRFSSEVEEVALVVFSSTPGTDTALAWLTASILDGSWKPEVDEVPLFAHPASRPRGKTGEVLLPDENVVSSWIPAKVAGERANRAYSFGDVSKLLRRVHELVPPRLISLESDEITTEAAAFTSLYKLQKANNQRSPKIALLSHPYQLPYLTVLAETAGLEVLHLNLALYSSIPWADFGCSPFGYSRDVDITDLLAEKSRELHSVKGRVNADLYKAADATLAYHGCVAKFLEDRKSLDADAHKLAAKDVRAAATKCSQV
mmetsp:Transcript_93266/g.204140  ORF Transcript_93266/g.204140 Transcript_93266/m.204140 type:complete len:347 (-) Transcript_93266:100-1140(-)